MTTESGSWHVKVRRQSNSAMKMTIRILPKCPKFTKKPVWHKSEADDSGHGRVASEAANTVLGSSLVCHACVTTLQASKLDEQ
jgi:hypothetical protein